MVSSDKSLVHLMTLIRQFDEVLSTLEVIKLAKVSISIYGGLCKFSVYLYSSNNRAYIDFFEDIVT